VSRFAWRRILTQAVRDPLWGNMNALLMVAAPCGSRTVGYRRSDIVEGWRRDNCRNGEHSTGVCDLRKEGPTVSCRTFPHMLRVRVRFRFRALATSKLSGTRDAAYYYMLLLCYLTHLVDFLFSYSPLLHLRPYIIKERLVFVSYQRPLTKKPKRQSTFLSACNPHYHLC